MFLMYTLVMAYDMYQIAIDTKVGFTSPLGAKNCPVDESQVDTMIVQMANRIEFPMSVCGSGTTSCLVFLIQYRAIIS